VTRRLDASPILVRALFHLRHARRRPGEDELEVVERWIAKSEPGRRLVGYLTDEAGLLAMAAGRDHCPEQRRRRTGCAHEPAQPDRGGPARACRQRRTDSKRGKPTKRKPRHRLSDTGAIIYRDGPGQSRTTALTLIRAEPKSISLHHLQEPI
jgi:hypothetical protein